MPHLFCKLLYLFAVLFWQQFDPSKIIILTMTNYIINVFFMSYYNLKKYYKGDGHGVFLEFMITE